MIAYSQGFLFGCLIDFLRTIHLPLSLSMEQSVGLSEKETFVEALKRNSYNRLAAAKDLGVYKSTFFRKVNK